MESLPGSWCEAVCIDMVGTYIRTVEKATHPATLVVRVRQLTNVQKQVHSLLSHKERCLNYTGYCHLTCCVEHGKLKVGGQVIFN